MPQHRKKSDELDKAIGYDIDNDNPDENKVINDAIKHMLDCKCKYPGSPFSDRVTAGLIRNKMVSGNPLDPSNKIIGKKFWGSD